MSMLAGPRRKQKFTLNPRGKHWSEDPNKFGQKMLEKMGWSAGKGLGAKEQGMVDHVRVKVKNDQVGIGYEKDKDDHWTGHQDDFNSFLQNLQKEQAGVVEETESNNKILSGKSLEEKSKQSNKRVHYKKFTRGKDVNKYSTKDLANIFGKKDLNEKIVIKEEKVEEEVEIVYDPIGFKDTTAGVLTIKGGNMDDYFKKKSYGGQQNGTSQEVKEEPDDEDETHVGFGYSSKSMSKFYVNDNDESKDQESEGESKKYVGFGFTKSSESKSKVKKRMNLNYVYDNPCLDLNILDNSPIPKKLVSKVIDLECSGKITPKKRKNEFSYDNEGLDLHCPERHTPKKRKSEYSYENKGMDLGYTENQIESQCNKDIYKVTEESLESTEKRKSKKSKKIKNEPLSNGIENPALDLNAPDRGIIESESVSPVSECSINMEDPADTKNKPRIIKCEIISNGFDNLGLDLNYTYKLTPKKIREVEVYENPALDLDISDGPTPKKNRKMESKGSLNAFDNLEPNQNLSTAEKINDKNISNGICNPGLDLNFVDTPMPKKSKKNKESFAFAGLENPGLEIENKSTPKKPKRSKSPKTTQVLSSGLENPGLDLEFIDSVTPKKSRKSKSLSISNEFENPGLEENSFTNEICSSMDYEVSRTSGGVENNALDLSDENSSKRRVTFNDQLEYNTDITKKKKKKKKSALDKYEVVTDKLKKKHKLVEPESTTAFVNEGLDLHIKNEEEIENEINERKSRKSKRKKTRSPLLATIEEAPEEENSNETPNVENEIVSEDVVMSELCENMCVDTVDNGSEDVPAKKSKKKKKAKKDAAEDIQEIEVHNESIVKKKKKTAVKEEPTEIVEAESPEKENKCTKNDKIKKTDKKIKKKSIDEDVISLEEFLNEDEVPKTKQNSKSQSTDSKKFNEMEKIEVAVPKENNENSYQRFKKTKEVMKSLFAKNPTLMFTGSNINEIKGYGSQFYDNY